MGTYQVIALAMANAFRFSVAAAPKGASRIVQTFGIAKAMS